MLTALGRAMTGAFEHYIVSHIKRVIPESVQTFWHEYRDALRRVSVEVTGGEEAGQAAETAVVGHAEHAVEKDKSGASKFSPRYPDRRRGTVSLSPTLEPPPPLGPSYPLRSAWPLSFLRPPTSACPTRALFSARLHTHHRTNARPPPLA